jgi:hypothetical protein
MDEFGQSRFGGLNPASPDSSEPPRKVSRLLLLWPLAGFVGLVTAIVTYRPLDDTLCWIAGGIPCVAIFYLINVSWRKAQRGNDIPSFFPRTIWLATACLLVPMVLFANGALDHSPVAQHRQVVTRTILEHGRHGNIYYYLELTSWRAGRTHEKVMVSEGLYLGTSVGDSMIVETHKGALGIPLVVSVHSPNLSLGSDH